MDAKTSGVLADLAMKWQDEAAESWGESPEHATLQRCADELRAVIADQEAREDIAPRHGDDAGDGLRFVMCQFGAGDHYRDMLLIPHVQGGYVTAAKLQPFGSAIIRAALARCVPAELAKEPQ